MQRFSIIIPCYNSAGTIVSVLESLSAQSFKDFEVIIIDDKSTDDTVAKIAEYTLASTLNISVIENIVNSGPGFSRNEGIRCARGQYLCFMDSDDVVAPNYFEAINEQLQKGADVVYFNCILAIGTTHIRTSYESFPSKEDYIALSSGSLCMFCSARNLWRDIELPAIRNAEDIAVVPIVLSRAKKITTIPDHLYYYINNNNSLSNTYRPEVSENFLKSFVYTSEHIDRVKYQEELEFHGIKTILYGATLNAIRAKLPVDTIKDYWDKFDNEFPKWFNNKYLRQYSKFKKIFLVCVRLRLYNMLKLYVFLHTSFLRFKSR